jgi:hypothetical protein
LPANIDVNHIATLRECYILDQPAQELFALSVRGCGSIPQGREICGQSTDLFLLFSRQGQRGWPRPRLIFTFQTIHLQQFLIPVSLQATRDESILRVYSRVATSSQVRLILRSLNLPSCLLINLLGSLLQVSQSRKRDFQMCRLDSLQKTGGHGLINPISSHGLASFCG